MPEFKKVAIKLKPDEEKYTPIDVSSSEIIVKSTKDVILADYGITDIDCGIFIEISAGYKLNVVAVNNYLFIPSNRIENNRLILTIINFRGIFEIKDGCELARLTVSPIYDFEKI